MWSPTLVANPFAMMSPNYLLNTKLGEKRNIFKSKSEIKKSVDSHSYFVIPHKPFEFARESIEFNMTNPFINISKYGNKMPFHVPPLKVPPIVGGFVGAKSQMSRGDSGIKLHESFNNLFNFGNCDTSNRKEPLITKIAEPLIKKMAENFLAELLSHGESHSTIHENSISISKPPTNCRPVSTDTKNSMVPETPVKEDTEAILSCISQNSQATNSKMNIASDDPDNPPNKKAKLSIKSPSNSSRRKRGKRKKRRKKTTPAEHEISSPAYDPVLKSFEIVDEVDCGIVLKNRFAPLENEVNFDMCCESPAGFEAPEGPLLNMLNEMHLDDFEIEFETSAPSTELCAVHSYKDNGSMKESLTCNSSIAFILSGNDDILTSDSEDGSFAASDVEDFQWQSFKADFEFYKGSVEEILVGTFDNSPFQFEASLEVLDDDDNFFLNELELQSDCESLDTLRQINQRWNQVMMGKGPEELKATKVCFAPDNCLTIVYNIPSGPEERQARKGSWDQCYMDRCRFQNRIRELEPLIAPCLTPQHRKSVFQRLFNTEEASL